MQWLAFLVKSKECHKAWQNKDLPFLVPGYFFLFLFLNHDNQSYKTMQLSHPSVSFASILVDNFFLEY